MFFKLLNGILKSQKLILLELLSQKSFKFKKKLVSFLIYFLVYLIYIILNVKRMYFLRYNKENKSYRNNEKFLYINLMKYKSQIISY